MEPQSWVLSSMIFLFSALCGLIAVSSQSLWIDEAHTAIIAMAPTGADFVNFMVVDRNSDLQMPLFMGLIWLWEKLAGASEFALRALNIPLFMGSLWVVFYRLRQPVAVSLWFVFLACLSPMVWSYLDEARPYILQFLAATLIMVALVNTATLPPTEDPPVEDLSLFLIGALVLCGSSLTGVIFTALFGIAYLGLHFFSSGGPAVFFNSKRLIRIGLAAILLGLLGAYYLWTLSVGARASSVGSTTPATMAFCGYELFGFSGFGPGRSQLRESWSSAIQPFIPQLIFFGSVLSAVIVAGLLAAKKHTRGNPRLLAVFTTAALGALVMTMIGVVMDFRVLGRHLIPILPFLILGLAMLAGYLWRVWPVMGRVLIVLFILSWLYSSLTVRFGQRFLKDDYRGAATIVKAAESTGQTIWWAADQAGANFYSLDVNPEGTHHILSASNIDTEKTKTLPDPDLIILSKPDIYDANGALTAFIKENSYTLSQSLPGMAVWQKPAHSPHPTGTSH